ncbi:MAG: hypothetical protein LKI80_12200 [Sporolactobacillus sp.]|jgi:hypothetical protein|nr:hypothetical protein [Sporolactobacillus sp.]
MNGNLIERKRFSSRHLRFIPIGEIPEEKAVNVLQVCYGDRYLQMQIDDHNCETNFKIQNRDEMARCIHEWRRAWVDRRYFRWIVEARDEPRTIGTIEIASIPDTNRYIDRVLAKESGTFVENPTHLLERGAHHGVLRLDIISDYAYEVTFDALLHAADRFFADFQLAKIVVQCLSNDEERKKALNKDNYRPLRNREGCLAPYFVKTAQHKVTVN